MPLYYRIVWRRDGRNRIIKHGAGEETRLLFGAERVRLEDVVAGACFCSVCCHMAVDRRVAWCGQVVIMSFQMSLHYL